MVKKSACNAEDLDSIPESGRSPGGENGYQLQNSCLDKSMDRGAQWAIVHAVTKNWTQLSLTYTHTHRPMAAWSRHLNQRKQVSLPGFLTHKNGDNSCVLFLATKFQWNLLLSHRQLIHYYKSTGSRKRKKFSYQLERGIRYLNLKQDSGDTNREGKQALRISEITKVSTPSWKICTEYKRHA